MKLTKMKRRLMGFSVIAAMGVSLFSAGADVLTVKAAEAEIPEEAVTATEEVANEETTVTEEVVTTSEEATETEVAEEIRVEAGADVAINETNFPDSTFREYVKQFDTDNNGILSNIELSAVTEIDVSGGYLGSYGDIVSLKGIEYFTAITRLSCFGNKLTNLDLSKNIALTSLDCGNNQLTSLDLSKNTALRSLYCGINQLTNLDVSGCTAFISLNCHDNKLMSLDVSGCTALEYLWCANNKLINLDLSNNTALISINCQCNNLTSLGVSKSVALIELNCYGNKLTSLDVSRNTALKDLNCANNRLTSLDLSKNTVLKQLFCHENELTSLDVSKNIALRRLYCGVNRLTSLDVSKNTALDSLNCNDNNLTSLDVSNNTALKDLCCCKNQIESGTLDISNNTELTGVLCDGDALPSIDAYKDIRISLYTSLYKKGSRYYIDLSETSLDKTRVSEPHIGTYDSATGYLTVPGDMGRTKEDEERYTYITYDFGNKKGNIYIGISEEIDIDSLPEYQGYYFYENKRGDKYCFDSNGNKVINEFKCDGTYTYYFQADGTAMRDRLTYHPDGVHVIYFDEEGHEVFSNFHEVKKSIAGDAVNDLCFFDVYGYMYVDVMTYGNAAFGNGDKIYYINPYGVIERNGWFGFSETCVWAGTDKKVGTGIGYANADGSLMINQHTYYNGNLVYMQGDGHMK